MHPAHVYVCRVRGTNRTSPSGQDVLRLGLSCSRLPPSHGAEALFFCPSCVEDGRSQIQFIHVDSYYVFTRF